MFMSSEIDHYLSIVTFTPAVVGYLRNGDRVCLGVRKRVSHGLGQNLIAGIGGKVGDMPETRIETPEQAMDRETSEEVQVRILEKQAMGRLRFIFAHKSPDSSWQQDVNIYAISKWEGTPTETATTRPVWFDINSIPWDRMWKDNPHWLPKVLSGEPVNATFLFSGDNKIADYRFDEVV
jgi:ADP-ribose pyrophosphatase YjhB (NUDIX family)